MFTISRQETRPASATPTSAIKQLTWSPQTWSSYLWPWFTSYTGFNIFYKIYFSNINLGQQATWFNFPKVRQKTSNFTFDGISLNSPVFVLLGFKMDQSVHIPLKIYIPLLFFVWNLVLHSLNEF